MSSSTRNLALSQGLPGRHSRLRYTWLVLVTIVATGLWAGSAAGQSFVVSGSYTGNGVDDRAITGLGFTPDVVIVKGDDLFAAFCRTGAMPDGMSKPFGNPSNLVTDGVKTLAADGFALGTNIGVNGDGTTYHWVAFKAETGTMTVGSYEGDGSNSRYLAGAGFTPSAVLVFSATNRTPLWRTDAMPLLTSLEIIGDTSHDAGITSLVPDGFVVGNNQSVNAPNADYYYIACGPTGNRIRTGAYIGDGSGPRDITGIGIEPAYVMLKSDLDATGVHRIGALGADPSSLAYSALANLDEGITGMGFDTFQVGSGPEANPSGSTVYWMAFAESTLEADLAVDVQVDDPAPVSGAEITFTIQLTNAGPDEAPAVQVLDALPVGLTFVSATPSEGSFDPGTDIWDLGLVPDGATSTLQLRVLVDGGTQGQTLINAAAIVASGAVDNNSGNNSNSASVLVGVPPTGQFLVEVTPGTSQTVFPGADSAAFLNLRFVNIGGAAGTIDSLNIVNLTAGTGTIAQLDAEWMPLTLTGIQRVNGVPVDLPVPGDRTFIAGEAAFSDLGWSIPAGDTLEVSFLGSPSLQARDNAELTGGIATLADIGSDVSVLAPQSWPLLSGHTLQVNGFVAAQATLQTVGDGLLSVGSERNPALAVDLPSNGFLDDELRRLDVVNLGSAQSGTDLAGISAWADDGDGLFDPALDTELGAFVFTGNRWEMTGLATLIPTGGRRFFVTVDIAETARPGRDIRLGIPAAPETGVGMASENDGPVDLPLENSQSQGITVSDRIILTPEWIDAGVTHPGATGLQLLQVVVTNTYATEFELNTLSLTNTSEVATADIGQRDVLCEQVFLVHDGNGNGLLDDSAVDPTLGSGAFVDDRLTFAGLNLSLTPGESLHLFATANLGLGTVSDGDRISAAIESGADIIIPGASVVAYWPMTSSSGWIVDGLVAEQLVLGDINVITLGPGDGPALAMDVVVPANGYLADTMAGMEIRNTGSAGPADLSEVMLWEDGGDGFFDAGGGDDTALGEFTFLQDHWTSPLLSRTIPLDGAHLYVSLIAGSPDDSASVRFEIPVDGLTLLSGNSGPIDQPVTVAGTLVLSTSMLRSTVAFSTTATTVGQAGFVRMSVRNAGDVPILAVTPQVAFNEGMGLISLDSPQPASVDLYPGQERVISWVTVSQASGRVVLSASAIGTEEGSGLERRSVGTPTLPHLVLDPVSQVDLFPTTNLPFSINQGQQGVVPMTLTLSNPDGASASDALVSSLTLRFMETEAGPVIPAAELLDRVVISEGTNVYVDRSDSLGSGTELELQFNEPMLVSGTEPATLGIRLDLRVNTTVPSFLVSIENAGWLTIHDAVNGQTVPMVLGEGTFPVRSAQGTIVAPATGVTVAVTGPPAFEASPGQSSVPLLEINIQNESSDNQASAVEIGALTFLVRDGAGAPVNDPAVYLAGLNLESAYQLHYRDVPVCEDSLVTLILSTPITIPANSAITLNLSSDLAVNVPLGRFNAELGNPDNLPAKDSNTGEAVPVLLVGDAAGGQVTILAPATGLDVSGSGSLPTDLARGTRNVDALALRLDHPGVDGQTSIAIDGLTFQLLDAARQPLDPGPWIDRIRITAGEAVVGAVDQPQGQTGLISIPVVGLVMDPSSSLDVVVTLDVEPDAPPQALELILEGTGVAARDEISGEAVAAVAADGFVWPLSSGLARIVVPADAVVVRAEDLMPPVLAPQPIPYPILQLQFHNPAPPSAGGIAINELVFGQTVGKADDVPLGTLLAEVRALVAGEVWASATEIDPAATSVILTPVEPLLVNAGAELTVQIEALIKPTAPPGQLVLQLDGDGISAGQPGGEGTFVRILPAEGFQLPFATAPGNVGPTSLTDSYINFPNPFAAGREATTFAYSLPASGKVTLRVMTPHGETVATLLDQAVRDAGLHQQDVWSGLNGRGDVVRNGVYLAEITVEFADGTRQRELRKVAVVR